MPEPRLVALPSLDELYTAAPEEFVAARNALAKELKAAGDKETAAEVTKLRRPPVSAWALNQVAREGCDHIAALLDAAGRLAAALGGDGDVRETQRAFRSAIEAVVRAATDVVTASGRTPSPSFQQLVQATLQAAAVDDGIAAALRAGVLAEDEPAPGFLFGDGPVPVRTPRSKPTKKAPSTAKGPRKLAAVPDPPAPDARAAAREAARAETERKEAERKRRAQLAKLRADVERLERRADRLGDAADKAELAAREAREDADAARAEATDARAALDAVEADGG